ncbi:MAG: hypothetical protein JWM36_697 [Hyphomicrobiales bacterium]|nr:hypothetical protein [Hyphomicrobiales bacterium]
MSRRALPSRRRSELLSLQHAGHAYVVGASRFEDGDLAEVFVDALKGSSALADSARDAAILASLALQFGCPAHVLRHALARSSEGNAAGPLGAALDLLEGHGDD